MNLLVKALRAKMLHFVIPLLLCSSLSCQPGPESEVHDSDDSQFWTTAEGDRWLIEAAERGDARAQGIRGTMYLLGKGAPKDYVKAYMWYDLAVANGDTESVSSRDLVASFMTPGQIAEGKRLAREWRPTTP